MDTKFNPQVKWLDGNVWGLSHGEDFSCSVESVRRRLHNFAAKHDCTVETTTRQPGIDIAFKATTTLQEQDNAVTTAFSVAQPEYDVAIWHNSVDPQGRDCSVRIYRTQASAAIGRAAVMSVILQDLLDNARSSDLEELFDRLYAPGTQTLQISDNTNYEVYGL